MITSRSTWISGIPFVLHLFSKLVDKAPQQVKIEEMLPAPDQLLGSRRQALRD